MANHSLMIKMLAALFTLCLLQHAMGKSVGDITARREVREVDAPAPIDCKMSTWSEWGRCDPCTKTMHRSRGIEVFGQFGGKKCIDPIGDKMPCVPTTICQEDPPPVCKSTEFQCESGLCIKKRLTCNGDNDCDDFSDEDECDKVRSPCGDTPVSESDIGRAAGYGINILGSGPRMNPFNNKIYNGMCERIKEPSSLRYERLPWNVAVLHFETLVEETSSREIYKDTHSLISEITKETTAKTKTDLSFKFTPTETATNSNGTNLLSLSGGVNFETEKSEMIKAITEYSTTKGKSFYRVKGKVQLGTYRLRSRGLEVSELFLDAVDALPTVYEKGQYFGFLEDYGTHYTKNGRAGGEYDLVYVLNEDIIKQKQVSETTLNDCLKIGINGDFQVAGEALSGQIDPKADVTPHDKCDKVTNTNTAEQESSPTIEKVISAVKGGTTQSAAAMKSQLNKDGVLNWEQYVEWARTLSDIPALIYSDPEPIYNAIPLNFPDAQPRRENLYRAIQEYMAEYSLCKCQPCQNGGTVAQVDGQCVCLCPMHYEGIACQILRHELVKDNKLSEPQGNWGCWSPWSSCSGRKQTRTRICNMGSIAGAKCKGENISEDYC